MFLITCLIGFCKVCWATTNPNAVLDRQLVMGLCDVQDGFDSNPITMCCGKSAQKDSSFKTYVIAAIKSKRKCSLVCYEKPESPPSKTFLALCYSRVIC